MTHQVSWCDRCGHVERDIYAQQDTKLKSAQWTRIKPSGLLVFTGLQALGYLQNRVAPLVTYKNRENGSHRVRGTLPLQPRRDCFGDPLLFALWCLTGGKPPGYVL